MSLVPHVRDIARQLDADAGLFNVATMEQVVSNRISRERMYAVLLGIFAGVAGALAAIGIYGVMAYSVAQRTREIGIRTALGARPADVMVLVLGQSTLVTVVGIAAGLAGAAALDAVSPGDAVRAHAARSVHVRRGLDCVCRHCDARGVPAGAPRDEGRSRSSRCAP